MRELLLEHGRVGAAARRAAERRLQLLSHPRPSLASLLGAAAAAASPLPALLLLVLLIVVLALPGALAALPPLLPRCSSTVVVVAPLPAAARRRRLLSARALPVPQLRLDELLVLAPEEGGVELLEARLEGLRWRTGGGGGRETLKERRGRLLQPRCRPHAPLPPREPSARPGCTGARWTR